MKMFKNKKGIWTLLLSPVMLTIMGVLILLVLLTVFGFTYFLTLNVYTLLGTALALIGGIGLLRGFAGNVGFTLIAIGIILILLPMLSERIAGVTLATLMP